MVGFGPDVNATGCSGTAGYAGAIEAVEALDERAESESDPRVSEEISVLRFSSMMAAGLRKPRRHEDWSTRSGSAWAAWSSGAVRRRRSIQA